MNEYEDQAQKFLADTHTTLEIVKAVPQKQPLWWNSTKDRDIKHGINYSVTLSNKNHKYTFDFWGSIADAEKVELAKEAKARGVYSSHYFEIKDWCDARYPRRLTARSASTEESPRIFIDDRNIIMLQSFGSFIP